MFNFAFENSRMPAVLIIKGTPEERRVYERDFRIGIACYTIGCIFVGYYIRDFIENR